MPIFVFYHAEELREISFPPSSGKGPFWVRSRFCVALTVRFKLCRPARPSFKHFHFSTEMYPACQERGVLEIQQRHHGNIIAWNNIIVD